MERYNKIATKYETTAQLWWEVLITAIYMVDKKLVINHTEIMEYPITDEIWDLACRLLEAVSELKNAKEE